MFAFMRRLARRIGFWLGSAVQFFDFARRQFPEFAVLEPFQFQRAHLDAREFAHLMANPCEHPSDLMIPAFAQGNFQDAFISSAANDFDPAAPGFESTATFWI